MQRVAKPKTARSKRALMKREPQLEENVKKAVFARASTSSQTVNKALSELLALKKPDGISFSKANQNIHPFEDATPLEFWSQKNDAALIVLGSHSKKRPNNLTIARMFDHQLLDMLELGVEELQALADFKNAPTSGLKPLFHFSGDLFESHPKYKLFKSLMLDMFHGQSEESIDLKGLQHVISVSLAPPPTSSSIVATDDDLPRLIHFRTYALNFLKSGSRTPHVNLTPCGPFFDLTLRRIVEPAADKWKKATVIKRKATSDESKSKKKMRKNVDLDTMGNTIGQLHVGKQDLSKLQSRKMKGLK